MVVVLLEWQLLAIVGGCFLLVVAAISIFFSIRNNAPDAFTHWKAARKGKAICRVHFKGRGAHDYIAEIDKDEKGMGTNYWRVPEIGLKFKPGNEDIEFIEGSIPCVNYFENLTTAVKVNEAIAYSQLKDYFKKLNVPIDGVESAALYLLQESEKKPIERALKNTHIESEETKRYLRKFLDVVRRRDAEIKALKQESGIFTWQTAMKALDGTIAFTSSHFSHAKEVIIAAALRKEEDNKKKMIEYAIIAVILAIAGVILLYGLKGL